MYCVWQVVKTPTIISNNPVFLWRHITFLQLIYFCNELAHPQVLLVTWRPNPTDSTFRKWRRPPRRNLASRSAWVMTLWAVCGRHWGWRYGPPECGFHLPGSTASYCPIGFDDDPTAYGRSGIIWHGVQFCRSMDATVHNSSFTRTSVNACESNIP